MTKRFEHSGPPRMLYSAIEIRAFLEMATLPWALPLLLRMPRGDGHPVLLIPGFLSEEWPLAVLGAYLRNRGHHVETWGIGRNLGFQKKHVLALEQKVRYLHYRHGRKVSLVGWSLGGVFALYIAHQAAECTRNVITLGSPVSLDPRGSALPPFIKAMYRLVAHPLGATAHTMRPGVRKARAAPPTPTSCLYSLSDGVVPPQEATIGGDPALHENIHVTGSHLGLGFNPMVLAIVADRLAQPEGHWHPFAPSGVAGHAYRCAVRFSLPA